MVAVDAMASGMSHVSKLGAASQERREECNRIMHCRCR